MKKKDISNEMNQKSKFKVCKRILIATIICCYFVLISGQTKVFATDGYPTSPADGTVASEIIEDEKHERNGTGKKHF